MTFKFKVANKGLKAIVSAFASLTEELTLNISPDGLKCKARDPSKVMLLDVKWPKEEFVEFECDKDIQVGVIMQDLNNVVKRFAKDDIIEGNYNEGKLTLTNKQKEYEISLIGPDTQSEIPDADTIKAEWKVVFNMSLSELNVIIDDLSFIDEYLTMECKDGSITCSANSNVSSKGKIVIPGSFNTEGKATWNIPYLQSVTKAVSDLAEKTTVSFGINSPIKLEMYITEKLKLTFLLAPKM